jgi:hypothetical protein
MRCAMPLVVTLLAASAASAQTGTGSRNKGIPGVVGLTGLPPVSTALPGRMP